MKRIEDIGGKGKKNFDFMENWENIYMYNKGKFKKQKSHVSNMSGGPFYHKISLEILETSNSINHLPDSVDFFSIII